MQVEKGKIYIVATPIGNLGDISKRVAKTLEEVDFIAAEDTRVTLKLLNHLGIKKQIISCYSQNEQYKTTEILSRVKQGESCALCSDAGTPAISDPGEKLISSALDEFITVVPIAGPCAAITALSACGLNVGRFVFEGFIPVSKQRRRERLELIKNETRAIVFYEAPHKLRATLKDLLELYGEERRITISRELTKLHEEIIRTDLKGANEMYEQREPKGEFVLVVDRATETPEDQEELSIEEIAKLAYSLVLEGQSMTDACKKIASESRFSKNEIYKAVSSLRQD